MKPADVRLDIYVNLIIGHNMKTQNLKLVIMCDYVMEDLASEEITGNFYEQELWKRN